MADTNTLLSNNDIISFLLRNSLQDDCLFLANHSQRIDFKNRQHVPVSLVNAIDIIRGNPNEADQVVWTIISQKRRGSSESFLELIDVLRVQAQDTPALILNTYALSIIENIGDITGDAHGEIGRFSPEVMPQQAQWSCKDKLIFAGDFGYVFLGEKRTPAEKNNLDALAQKPFEILFVDGNHEGFDALAEYPEVIRYGAPVRKIRDNIYWLQRGYIYNIDGKRIFVMGGAYSMDKAFRLDYYRISGQKIWFEQELPCSAEYQRAIENLKACNMEVDYVITHTAPISIACRLLRHRPDMHDSELTGFLDWVYHEVRFQKWFFGHFHEDTEIYPDIIACYTAVHSLE